MNATFNLDNIGEVSYDPDNPFVENELDIFVEEIKLCLSTGRGSVMGAMGMDGDLERYIFSIDPDINRIQNQIVESISKYSLLAANYNYNVEVMFAKGNIREVCLVLLDISNKFNPKIKTTTKIVIS